MSVRQRLYLLGGGLLLLGLAAGFIPFVSSHGVGCGSAFIYQRDTTSDAAKLDIQESWYGVDGGVDCSASRNPFRYLAIALLAAGGVCVAGGWVAAGRRPVAAPTPQ
jgi:hypothetical protein